MAPLTENKLLSGALWYAQNLGWKVLPVWGIRPDGLCSCGKAHNSPKDIGKHAILTGRHEDVASSDPSVIRGWWETWPDANVAIWAMGSGILTVDVDPRSDGDRSFARLMDLIEGDFPTTFKQNTGNYPVAGRTIRGSHYIFKAPPGHTYNANLNKFELPGIDVKYNGYFLVYPSKHLTAVTYEWDPKYAPWAPGVTLSAPSEKLMSYISKGENSYAGARNATTGLSRGTGLKGSWDFVKGLELPTGGLSDVDSMLKNGIHEGGRAIGIYRLAIYWANRYGTEDVDVETIISTLQKFNYEHVTPPLEQDELMRQITLGISFSKNNPLPKYQMSAGFRAANQEFLDRKTLEKVGGGPTPAPISPAIPYVNPTRVSTSENPHLEVKSTMSTVPMSLDPDAIDEEHGAIIGSRSFSDTGNGRRFVDAFGQEVRYTPGLGWFVWNGLYWHPDAEDLQVHEKVKMIPAIVAEEAASMEDSDMMKAGQKWAVTSRTIGAQSATIKMAKTDQRIGVPVDYWDGDPYMLGVKNGVLDLRTGELMTGRPDLHITRRCPVGYTPGLANLKRFQGFLDYATGYDKSYQAWLQRAIGYTITGLNTLDVLFLMYGPPGSGKNVMVEAIVKLLGTKQYAFPLDSSILAQGDGRSNQTDMYHWAEMRGRRMIWVDELPESERIKENQVKKLTGSSEISARSPGEKPFTFESQGKLWITTNHRPIITDDAMWRRIRPIPWTNVPTEPDPTLKAYLHDPEGGLPAILAWAVEGAKIVLNSSDPDPVGWCDVVSNAAKMYQENEDRIGLFLGEEFEEDVTSTISIKDLYAPYGVWCTGRGEYALSQIRFMNKLSERGLQISGTGNRAIIYGYKRRPLPDILAGAGSVSDFDWNEILKGSGS